METSHDPQPDAPMPPIPWEETEGRPLKALLATIKECLLHPLRFFAHVPRSEDRWVAIGYAVILYVFGASCAAIWSLVLSHPLEVPLLRLVLAPLFVLASVWLGSEMMHGFLKLFRGTELPRTITHRAVAYCYSTSVLGLVPVVGLGLGTVLSIVYQVMALRQAHGTRTWKALLAVLLTWGIFLGMLALATLSGQPLDQDEG